MSETQVTKEAVSVSEMARMVGLSRARFYQLMAQSFFPSPVRQNDTGRPFFSRGQQEQCLKVRRTNRGVNGQAILFYALRVQRLVAPSAQTPSGRSRPTHRQPHRTPSRDPVIAELRQGLTQLGLTDVSDQVVVAALVEEYADGHDDVDRADLLSVVFGHLNRQDSPDNVTR